MQQNISKVKHTKYVKGKATVEVGKVKDASKRTPEFKKPPFFF